MLEYNFDIVHIYVCKKYLHYFTFSNLPHVLLYYVYINLEFIIKHLYIQLIDLFLIKNLLIANYILTYKDYSKWKLIMVNPKKN